MEELKWGFSEIGKKLAASLASDAAFIGGITILGYVTAYSYLSFQAQTLGIPDMLVSVSLEACLIVVMFLVVALLFLSVAINLVTSMLPARLQRSLLFRNSALISLLFIGIIWASFHYSPVIFYFLFAPIVLLAYFIVVPLTMPKKGRTFFERLDDKMAANVKLAKEQKAPDWLEVRTGLPVRWFVLVPAFAIVCAATFGKVQAELTTYYFATQAKVPEVLLSRYGDILVFRRLGTTGVTIKVIGKDEIPPLINTHTGSMAVNRL